MMRNRVLPTWRRYEKDLHREDAEADLDSGFQPRRTPKLPVYDETATEHGVFSGILSFNRSRLEPIRGSYPEQKKLDEKIVEEEWDIVVPVNARQEARSRKGHDSRGIAREKELGEVVEEPAEAELEPGFQPRRTPRPPVDDENLKAILSISNVAEVRKGFA
jgi:hypothetical protein